MGTKEKNRKPAPIDSIEIGMEEVALDNGLTAEITTLITPLIQPGERLDFKKLKELSELIERHHDKLTSSNDKTTADNLLKNLPELNIKDLTQNLNDVEKSQAAMLIRYIIKNHPYVEKIFLEHNTFSPPDLHFIINALIFVKHDNSKQYTVRSVDLSNAVHAENLERSSVELRHLKKSYGNTINLDKTVYQHFVDNYKTACDNYLKYLAEKIIIPKSKLTPEGDTIAFANKIVTEALAKNTPSTAKADLKFAAVLKKYQHIRDLQQIVYGQADSAQLFDQFEKHYASIKKQISTALNKEEETHQERFHTHVGEIEFINTSLAGKNVSIFKRPETKKKKRAKAKSKAKSKTKSKTKVKDKSL